LVEIGVFKTQIVVAVGLESHELQDWFDRLLPGAVEEIVAANIEAMREYENTSYGFCQNSPNGAQFISVRTKGRSPSQIISTLAHEAIHAAMNIMRKRGIEVHEASEEVVCHVADYIVEHVLDVV
jgi:hypothetical protein